ncbi:hypothetical protein L1987_60387 [Smallanthus sonchifolius]|uniref:Uncharacterized protein n=1 Tax=Smallanthus sonchifolius TaxID=185202 RepID=A0ACB9D7Y5_9ASTR|nr:hypothetical protein L1987_60387 [Smallanthus sonchifolius]
MAEIVPGASLLESLEEERRCLLLSCTTATFDLQREWLSTAMLLISSKTQLSTAADDLPISSNFGLQQIRLSATDLFFSRRTSPIVHKGALEGVVHFDFPKEVKRPDVMDESSRRAVRKRRNTRSSSRSGSSSSAHMSGSPQTPPSPPSPYHPHPMPQGQFKLHSWLVFDPDDAIEVEAYHKLQEVLGQEFGIHKTICYTTLEEIELLNQCVELITKPWKRMARHWHEMSLAQFRVRMGMYRHREITQPVFTKSQSEISEGEASLFWGRIGSGPFDPHSQKSTKLKHPLHRYHHRCIVLTLGGRKDSTGVVSLRDLFHLHCLIDHVDCNLAYRVVEESDDDAGEGHLELAGGQGEQHGIPPIYHTTADPSMLDLMIRMGQLRYTMDGMRQDFHDHLQDPYAHQPHQQPPGPYQQWPRPPYQ